MKTFAEWCQHYDYDPSSEAATADYAKYQEQLNFFQQLEEPCFLDDEGYGYTKSLTEAGRFTVADMAAHNLDGCTLQRVQD